MTVRVLWFLCGGLVFGILFSMPRGLEACPNHCHPPKKLLSTKPFVNSLPVVVLAKSLADENEFH